MRTAGITLLVLLALAGPGRADAMPPEEDRGSLVAIPVLGDEARIAVLPFENLSGIAAPLGELREKLLIALESRWIPVLDDPILDGFMREQRMRYTGGLSEEIGEAFLSRAGAKAVLVTSIDLLDESDLPRLAVTSRLVSTGSPTRILWMDSASRTGDEEPGALGLGLIEDSGEVFGIVMDRLADSLAGYLYGTEMGGHEGEKARRRFRPKRFYRAEQVSEPLTGRLRVAVLPFANASTTRYAGEILSRQVVRSLAGLKDVDVLEPGVVRQALLRSRLIQQGGPSIPQADLLRALLNVDIVLFGEVSEYLEPGPGESDPMVDFSARAIDTASRQVVWSSTSHARGGDGVFFFRAGRVPTAQQLASEMARGLVGAILPLISIKEERS